MNILLRCRRGSLAEQRPLLYLKTMRAVIQRVRHATVSVEGRICGEIGPGLLVLAAVGQSPQEDDLDWMARKLTAVRVFPDEDGRMNRSLLETGGEILLVSQFTLYGSLKKGSRPSFNRAGEPADSKEWIERLRQRMEAELGRPVPTGEFGASMTIDARCDGPVTLVLDSRDRGF